MVTVLTNATLASFAPAQVIQAHLCVDGGAIAWIGEDPPADAEIVDCRGRVIVPGNVCAHTHLYSALARGMPGPLRPPTNFPEILERIWWRLDQALDEQGVWYSAAVGALDAIRAGTTTLVDHHASPNFIDGSLDVLADAVSVAGARALLCYEVTDRGGKDRARAGIRENERFISSPHPPTVRGMVGAHASFTLDDDTLVEVAELASSAGTGVHIHVAEDVCDEQNAVGRSGKRAAVRLADAGIFGPRSIAAHGVHLDANEIRVMQARDAWFVHNCRSNMNNSLGRAPVLGFGARCALGTDGIDENMFAESRTAFFRAREDDLGVMAEQFTERLARGGNLVSDAFGTPIGRLEAGAAADLVVLRYDPPTPLTAANLSWHWMFAMDPSLVESVIVQGRWVLRGAQFLNVDEEKIRAEARGQAGRLWERMEKVKDA